MDNCQRQTTPALCYTSSLQWNISFRLFIYDNDDIIECYTYNRSKYTTDRLLGSIEIPWRLLTEQ